MTEELGKETEIPMTVEPSESVPESEVEPVADEGEEKINWAPLENDKISGVLDLLAESMLKIKGVEMYRNPGKSDYFGFRVANMKGIAFIYLSAKGARVSIGEAVEEGGKVKGSFPRHCIFKAIESGFVWGDEKIKVKEIVRRVRAYIKARGWT